MLKIGPYEELDEGGHRLYEIAGNTWIVARVDDRLVAVMDRCGHIPQSLHNFNLVGRKITCGHHGVAYDVTTGAVLDALGFIDVGTLQTAGCEVREGELYIDLEEE